MDGRVSTYRVTSELYERTHSDCFTFLSLAIVSPSPIDLASNKKVIVIDDDHLRLQLPVIDDVKPQYAISSIEVCKEKLCSPHTSGILRTEGESVLKLMITRKAAENLIPGEQVLMYYQGHLLIDTLERVYRDDHGFQYSYGEYNFERKLSPERELRLSYHTIYSTISVYRHEPVDVIELVKGG